MAFVHVAATRTDGTRFDPWRDERCRGTNDRRGRHGLRSPREGAHSTSPRALAWDELLDWAGTRAADEDARWLRVDVWTTNERLQHHYLKQGFTSIGIVVLPHNPSGALFQRPAQRVPTPRLVEDLRRGFSRLSQRNPEIDRPVTPLS
jgi:hypothetical protein